MALRQVALLLLVGCLALAAALWVVGALATDTIAFDFRGTLWDAATAIREGDSPYPRPDFSEVAVGNPALYPPLLMLLVVPLTFLPWTVGAALWTATLATSIVLALVILRVRDIRCFALALLSIPVLQGLILGNAALLLVPLVALAWRWRDHAARAGVVIGLAFAAKLFLWPLVAWLVGTRRYRAAAYAVGTGTAAVVLPWAAIRFAGLAEYPDLLRVAEEIYATHSFSVPTVLAGFGVAPALASYGSIVAAVLLAAVGAVVGRRGADELAISIVIVAAILGSPIVWEYYYALLLIPLAIVWPRFSGMWVLVVALGHVAHALPWERLPAEAYRPGGPGCCKPSDVPFEAWSVIHSPPALWPALAHASLALLTASIVGVALWRARRLAPTSPANTAPASPVSVRVVGTPR